MIEQTETGAAVGSRQTAATRSSRDERCCEQVAERVRCGTQGNLRWHENRNKGPGYWSKR